MKLFPNQLPIHHWLNVFLLIMPFTLVNAQGEYTIRGKIRNESEHPVAYANIVMKDAKDSSLIGGTITNENGNFNFRTQVEENYLLSASFIGYVSVDTIIHTVDRVTDTVFLTMTREHTILDEVVIRKRRKRAKQQVDLTTYYVNSSMRSVSASGVDLISQVPFNLGLY